jgi:AcrR family transcriptional regulator
VSTPATRAPDIRDAARTLFARRGYAATSMRAIADAADVSLGLAYNYFSGKEDLLRAVVEDGIEQVRATLDELDGSAPPDERLRRFVHASLGAVRRHRAFWQVLYGLRQQPDAVEALRAELGALHDEVHARLRGLFAALGAEAPDVSARLLFAALDGVGQHYVRAPESYPLDAVAQQMVDRFRPPSGDAG